MGLRKIFIITMLISTQLFGGRIAQPKPKSPARIVHIVSKDAGIDITTAKVIHITGPISSITAMLVAFEGLMTENLPGDRVVILTSNGGSVDAGAHILDMLQNEKKKHPGMRLVCVTEGYAHSMAFNIMSFCDVKLATEGSEMLAHKVAYYPGGNDGVRLTAITLRQIADEMDIADEPYRQQNAKALHLSIPQYDVYADEQYMWPASELIKIKYLDGIAKIDPVVIK